MGHQVCCATSCTTGQEGYDVPQQRQGANGSYRGGGAQARNGQDLYMISSTLGLRIEKLEEDYQSDDDYDQNFDDDDPDLQDQLGYGQSSVKRAMNRKSNRPSGEGSGQLPNVRRNTELSGSNELAQSSRPVSKNVSMLESDQKTSKAGIASQEFKAGQFKSKLVGVDDIVSESNGMVPELVIEEEDPKKIMRDAYDAERKQSTQRTNNLKQQLKGSADDADNAYASDDEDQKSTGTLGQDHIPESVEVQVVMGGPVTPLFQVRTELRHKHIGFSQYRTKGFRDTFEFEKKRVMVCDDKQIQIFGYSPEDWEPYPIVTYSIDSTNEDVFQLRQASKELLGNSSPNGKDGLSQHSPQLQRAATANFKSTSPNNADYGGEISSYRGKQAQTTKNQAQPTSEVIQFAGFLSDYDPSLLFCLTYDTERKVSYLKVLKVHRMEDKEERSMSFAENAEKMELITSVKNNLNDGGVQKRVPFSSDNFQVTMDTDKQQLKISKRGQATINLKATNLPTSQASRHPPEKSSSPKHSSSPEMFDDGTSTTFKFSNQNGKSQSALGGRSIRAASQMAASDGIIKAVVSENQVSAFDSGDQALSRGTLYAVFSSKLVKFRDTKLRAVKFTQSGSRGKLLITFDQRGIIRFHKIRGLKTLQSFDFAEDWSRLDYAFTNHVETTRIELKHELQDQLYQENRLHQPSKMHSSIDSIGSAQRPRGTSNLEIRTILYYAGHILAVYQKRSVIDVFRVNGPLIERLDMSQFFEPSGLRAQQIDQIAMPRLDWQDREFDTQQRASKQLPRKILFAGRYQKVKPGGGAVQSRLQPFLMIFDRVKQDTTVVRAFKSRGLISSLSYGPYDNGHVLVGTTTGDFLAFNALTLAKICCVKVAQHPVTSITIEPTQAVLVGVQATQEVTALTFIEQKQKYLYIELGMKKFATLVVKTEQPERAKSRGRSAGRENTGCLPGF